MFEMHRSRNWAQHTLNRSSQHSTHLCKFTNNKEIKDVLVLISAGITLEIVKKREGGREAAPAQAMENRRGEVNSQFTDQKWGSMKFKPLA